MVMTWPNSVANDQRYVKPAEQTNGWYGVMSNGVKSLILKYSINGGMRGSGE
jgi:hypothetical protein